LLSYSNKTHNNFLYHFSIPFKYQRKTAIKRKEKSFQINAIRNREKRVFLYENNVKRSKSVTLDLKKDSHAPASLQLFHCPTYKEILKSNTIQVLFGRAFEILIS
jgi:hypothetical protein